jgi:RimJ/RimL family protein N-acetyltransferase
MKSRATRPPFPAVTLRTPRLTLRPVADDDAPALYAIFSDRDVMRYWSRPPMTDPEEAVTLVRDIRAGCARGEALQLAVEREGVRQAIGTCTLFHFHRTSRRAELGYALARPHWGQGLMHEALMRLVGYAFGELGLHRLEADIDPRNAASARSLARLGFRKEGTLRERWIVAGEVSDSDLYGLLGTEWRPD